MKLAIGCDHGGFALKEALLDHLKNKGVSFEDLGTYGLDSVDYPLYAAKVAHAVADGKADLGLLVCSTGLGISMAANKVKGIRAAVCTDVYCAEMCRRHNNANILCLGGKVVDPDTAVKILDVFLDTQFDGGRHQRRIDQIAQIEEGNL